MSFHVFAFAEDGTIDVASDASLDEGANLRVRFELSLDHHLCYFLGVDRFELEQLLQWITLYNQDPSSMDYRDLEDRMQRLLQAMRPPVAIEPRQTDVDPLRGWWEIRYLGTETTICTVTARDGLDALSAYAEAEGFVPYEDEATVTPSDDLNNGGQTPTAHRQPDGTWTAIFTNYEIVAVPREPRY